MRVIFQYQENESGFIVYPDDISMFSATDLFTEPGKIIAEYRGDLNLTPYIPAEVKPAV
jgi:hypothetical protein